jgi:hypothetical protein
MKSNTNDIATAPVQNIDDLRRNLKKEKETLVSMFLANTSLSELSEQFKIIDRLHSAMSKFTA